MAKGCTVPAECLATYTCQGGQGDTPTLQKMHEGAIVAPFVELTFGEGETLTVGNNSSPPHDTSIITSFQMGAHGSSGFGAEFEVFDHGGVMYRSIIRAMNKTSALASQELNNIPATYDFGWIVKNTSNDSIKISASDSIGKKLSGIISEVQTVFEGQNVKMSFKVTGLLYRTPDMRYSDVIGQGSTINGGNNKINLRSALKKLFLEYEPKFKDVKFKDKDGSENNFEFAENGADGPESFWPLSQEHQMTNARNWLNGQRSKNNLGFLIMHDVKENTIIIQEDFLNGTCCLAGQNLATYIVNGGNCSPVMEFNPTVKWVPALNPSAGATTGGASSGDNTQIVGGEPNGIQKAGTQTTPVAAQNQIEFRTPDNIPLETRKSFEVNLQANSLIENALPGFEADLKIHGDPYFSDMTKIFGRTVSVIVINPFHMIGSTWIQESNCNPILSNKNYTILGVNHQIQSGSYITTLKLMLTLPNVNTKANSKLGNCGTESFVDAAGKTVAIK